MQIINPLEIPDWNELILKHKNYSFFHTQEWAKVLVDTYKFTPNYFWVTGNDGLTTILPAMFVTSWITGKRIVSLPFSDYCPPLFSDDSSKSLILNKILEYCKIENLKFIEFRTLDSNFPSPNESFRKDYRHSLIINKKQDELFKAFSDNTKRNIKKANKEGLKLEIRNDENGIREFYKMNCITRKKHGLPPQPLSFFSNILKTIIKKGLGDIIFAVHKDNIIAGALYLKFKNKIIYKYGASYPEFNELRGNHFVMWEAIKKYSAEGYIDFDFGRTELNHDGLRRFKQGWAAEESYIYISRINHNMVNIPSEIKTSGYHNLIFSRTPLFFLRIIGGAFYKHMG